MRRALIALIFLPLAGLVSAQPQADNEDLVMRVIFEDCVGFVDRNETPFEGLSLNPITEEGRSIILAPARVAGTMHHLFSKRYVVVWGEDELVRYCMIQTVFGLEGEMRLTVKPTDFLDRMSQRAESLGLTERDVPDELSPLAISYWSEPPVGDDSELRISLLPTGANADETLLDIGNIIVAAGVGRAKK